MVKQNTETLDFSYIGELFPFFFFPSVFFKRGWGGGWLACIDCDCVLRVVPKFSVTRFIPLYPTNKLIEGWGIQVSSYGLLVDLSVRPPGRLSVDRLHNNFGYFMARTSAV